MFLGCKIIQEMPPGCHQAYGYEIALEFMHPALAIALCYGLPSHRPNTERVGRAYAIILYQNMLNNGWRNTL